MITNRILHTSQISDLVHVSDSGDQLEALFIKTVFFLPASLLANKRYTVERTDFLTGSEFGIWLDLQEAFSPDVQVRCDCHESILLLAKKVGISRRIDHQTQESFAICKLWYPSTIQPVRGQSGG